MESVYGVILFYETYTSLARGLMQGALRWPPEKRARRRSTLSKTLSGVSQIFPDVATLAPKDYRRLTRHSKFLQKQLPSPSLSLSWCPEVSFTSALYQQEWTRKSASTKRALQYSPIATWPPAMD